MPNFLESNISYNNILICETNTVTWETANNVVRLIKKHYPNSALYYVTVTKAYWWPDTIEWIGEYFYWIKTNELF